MLQGVVRMSKTVQHNSGSTLDKVGSIGTRSDLCFDLDLTQSSLAGWAKGQGAEGLGRRPDATCLATHFGENVHANRRSKENF